MDFQEYIDDYFRKREEIEKKVSSDEYIEWLYNYVSENKHADEEGALYTYKGIDAENGKLLGVFLDYVKNLAKQQRVLVVLDEECYFSSEKVTIKIKDKYFEIFRMFGQGSWTSVNLLEEEPDYAFVKI